MIVLCMNYSKIRMWIVLIDNLMTKMLYIIQEVHKSYVVHRDIKLHHFTDINGHFDAN